MTGIRARDDMRKVVDSNYLQTPEFRQYLSNAVSNHAVLMEYTAMEAYKGDTLKSIFPSMSVLVEFPNQVDILKPPELLCGVCGRSNGLQKRLIDARSSRRFPVYCKKLQLARAGDLEVCKQIVADGKAATERLDAICFAPDEFSEFIGKSRECFSSEELKAVQNSMADLCPITTVARQKIVDCATVWARSLYGLHPRAQGLVPEQDMSNTYLFRMAICQTLQICRWLVLGRDEKTRPDRTRNDLVDVHFATCATFFDGILTKDKPAMWLYVAARNILRRT